MKNILLSIFLLVLLACGSSKNLNTTSSNCKPAILESDLEVNRIDSTNAAFKFSFLDYADNEIRLVMNYSGGCAAHEFFLVRHNNQVSKDYHKFWISHNSNGDSCREWITDTICFDLSTIEMKKGDKFSLDGYSGEFQVD